MIMSAITLAALAQSSADIVVSYNYSFPSVLGGTVTDRMTLLANSAESKYFNELSLWTDSLESTPNGSAKLDEIIRASCLVRHPDGYDYWDFSKGPVKSIYTYVFSNIADGLLTVYDQWGDELMYYTEPSNEMQWELVTDSVREILGYECVLAETDYHGRHWKAWFTPDVPLAYGPWKLHGLPGLILNAEADGGFSFTATGMQNTNRLMTPMYFKNDYKKTQRKNAQADQEYFEKNLEAIIKAQNEGAVRITYSDDEGNEMAAPTYDAAKHCIEPDYKNK